MKNSIVLKSLELAGFQNPTAIAQILIYVPNPTVALEMLLGIHEPMVLDSSKIFRKNRWSEDKLFELLSIDELGDFVTYKEYRQNVQTVYYLTEEDYKKKIYQIERPEKFYDSSTIPATGYKESAVMQMNVQQFEKEYGTIVSIADAARKFEEWMDYGVLIEKDPTDLYNAELV